MLRTAWAHGEGLSRWIVYFSSRQAKCYPWWGQTLSELCAWNSVLVFCPDVFTLLGTTVPLASTKNGSGTRLLKFTAEFTEAMPFLKTHGKNFIVVSRPRAMEFLLRIKIFFSISILLFYTSPFHSWKSKDRGCFLPIYGFFSSFVLI